MYVMEETHILFPRIVVDLGNLGGKGEVQTRIVQADTIHVAIEI